LNSQNLCRIAHSHWPLDKSDLCQYLPLSGEISTP
jgi:hypothetical protein